MPKADPSDHLLPYYWVISVWRLGSKKLLVYETMYQHVYSHSLLNLFHVSSSSSSWIHCQTLLSEILIMFSFPF